MKLASLMCTYIYGSLAIVKAAIEGYRTVAKSLLKRIDAVAQAAITTIRYALDTEIETIINLVKVYEKELFDMLYDALFGDKKEFWCNRLWKCLALINELLDPNSWLFRKLNDWWKKQCKDAKAAAAENLLNDIRGIISDFSQFQQIVCSAGFTLEFGISYIKRALNYCREQLEKGLAWCERQIRRLKLLCEDYLNRLSDWGFMDYLNSLMSFFTCVFDDSMSCAEIATASNFYNDTLAAMKLQKDGDGYTLSTEYRNSIYGELEGTKNRISNLKIDVDNVANMCVDPQKLKKANAAYNLSERLLPHNEDGSVSWTKIKNGKFKECPMWTDWRMDKEALWDDMNAYRNPEDPEFTFTDLEDGTRLGEDGYLYYKSGCRWIKGKFVGEVEGRKDYVYINGDPDYDIMFDLSGNAMTVTQGAYNIYTDPDSDFAKECKNYHIFVKSWETYTDAAKRYATSNI